MTTAQDSGNHDALITGDELARMPDHDLAELIDGRIVPLSPTNPEHGRLEANVARVLGNFVSAQNLGSVRRSVHGWSSPSIRLLRSFQPIVRTTPSSTTGNPTSCRATT
jgi:Uma2 family endonuclease